jgi:hypothetical protein
MKIKRSQLNERLIQNAVDAVNNNINNAASNAAVNVHKRAEFIQYINDAALAVMKLKYMLDDDLFADDPDYEVLNKNVKSITTPFECIVYLAAMLIDDNNPWNYYDKIGLKSYERIGHNNPYDYSWWEGDTDDVLEILQKKWIPENIGIFRRVYYIVQKYFIFFNIDSIMTAGCYNLSAAKDIETIKEVLIRLYQKYA